MILTDITTPLHGDPRMDHPPGTDDATLRRILSATRIIAMVGLSADWNRPSHFAAKYLQQHGYRIVPVNPRYPEILGEPSYARLEDIPFKVDMVDVFRRTQDVVMLSLLMFGYSDVPVASTFDSAVISPPVVATTSANMRHSASLSRTTRRSSRRGSSSRPSRSSSAASCRRTSCA